MMSASAMGPSRNQASEHSLRTRLARFYSLTFFAAGVVLLAIADFSAIGLQETNHLGAGALHADHLAVTAPSAVVLGSALVLTLMIPLSLMLGARVAKNLLQPLQVMMETARHISASNLHERLDLNGADEEIRELSTTLNSLFSRLENAFASQRRFVANASHELRTPLAGQRTVLQVALADPQATAEELRLACEDVLRLGVQQQELIEALLTLASSERGIERWHCVDLGTIAEGVLQARTDQLRRREVHIMQQCEATSVWGDATLLECLVANLVDNALLYNVVGGRVDVATAYKEGRPSIVVRNSGPRVPDGEIPRLFEPFQRSELPPRSNGHGLGLAIVRAIVDAHDAAIDARSRPEGGLEVEVRFQPTLK